MNMPQQEIMIVKSDSDQHSILYYTILHYTSLFYRILYCTILYCPEFSFFFSLILLFLLYLYPSIFFSFLLLSYFFHSSIFHLTISSLGPIIAASLLIFKFAVYWKMQFISAGIVTGTEYRFKILFMES